MLSASTLTEACFLSVGGLSHFMIRRSTFGTHPTHPFKGGTKANGVKCVSCFQALTKRYIDYHHLSTSYCMCGRFFVFSFRQTEALSRAKGLLTIRCRDTRDANPPMSLLFHVKFSDLALLHLLVSSCVTQPTPSIYKMTLYRDLPLFLICLSIYEN